MLTDICENASFLLRITAKLVKYLHIIIPILLVILISFDLFKAMTGAADEKAKKEATTKAAKRFIYAAIVFLIPTIISIVFNAIDGATTDNSKATSTTSTSWISCWNKVYNK